MENFWGTNVWTYKGWYQRKLQRINVESEKKKKKLELSDILVGWLHFVHG